MNLFSTIDFMVIDALYEGRPIPGKFQTSLKRLVGMGIVEKSNSHKDHPYVLSRQLYSAVGETGIYTRKKGLDRETNKELLLKHIRENNRDGSKMEELKQVLPALGLNSIQSLLKDLAREGLVHARGRTKAGRWHEGPTKAE